jgi:hypothetical protein
MGQGVFHKGMTGYRNSDALPASNVDPAGVYFVL